MARRWSSRHADPLPLHKFNALSLLLHSFFLPVAFRPFPATLPPPTLNMLASTRMSTAQRPAATARAFTAVASATSKPKSAAPRGANGVAAAPARRSTLICRAEPGELQFFPLDFLWTARESLSFVSVERGNRTGDHENGENVLRGRKPTGEQNDAHLQKKKKKKKLLSSSDDDDDGGGRGLLLRRRRRRGLLLVQLGPRPEARGPAERVAQGGQGRREARAALLVPEPGGFFFITLLFFSRVFFASTRGFFLEREGRERRAARTPLSYPPFPTFPQPRPTPTKKKKKKTDERNRSTPSRPAPPPRAPTPRASPTPSSPRTFASSARRPRRSSRSRRARSSRGTRPTRSFAR